MAMIEENGECRTLFLRVPGYILLIKRYDGKVADEEGRDYLARVQL